MQLHIIIIWFSYGKQYQLYLTGKFYNGKNVTYYSDDKPLYETSEIVACEEKIKEAIAHVKYFADNKYRMSLTDKVIESMLLLADTVESQMEEVK